MCIYVIYCFFIHYLFQAHSLEHKQKSGTTALGAFIHAGKLTVYNIGDCRAILSQSGTAVSILLTLQKLYK